MQLFDRIKELTELQATSGHEAPVRDYLAEKMVQLGYQPEYDGLGGIFTRKYTDQVGAPTILIAAHMDEVGFMLESIKPDGTFRAIALGGWNPLVTSGQRFTLFTQTGQKIPLITGGLPPHLLRGNNQSPSLPSISDLIFDGGFVDRDEARAYGINPGDVIVPQVQTILSANQKNVIGKAWDNRYGCLMILQLLDFLMDKNLAVNLVLGANVQEEVGLRGAQVSTHKFKPDLFFAVDCSPASDPFDTETGNGKLGDGTTLRYFDPGHLLLPGMRDFLVQTARANQVKTQPYIAKGGTDAGAAHLQNDGVPSTTIGVVARYIHSHQTLFNLDDLAQAQHFLQAIVTSLNSQTVTAIKGYF